ncbi:hypothetical protein TWF481_001931 [Arthrobotrys musiformis]|uniref:Apple domain-containing protein n=1 Tax=Arthrobotrys musiformis TaxID=47236 RepID=A0AAV9VUW2_9PEZI
MHFSTLTGACLLALSAFANAYSYDSSGDVGASASTPVAGPATTQPAGPNKYSTSVYSTQIGTVKTIQTCTTEFCVLKPASVATSVATFYNNPVTKTVTKTESGIQYVTKKGETRTIVKTTTKPCTVTAKASVKTVYSTRVVKTTSVRAGSTVRKTVTVTPAYAGASTKVVPTPSGFVYASKDAANAPSNFPPTGESYVKRYAADEGAHYPKSIKCSKTLQTISTRTHTVGSKTTSIVYGNTATATYTKSVTTTVYPQAKTTTIVRVSTSTVISTSVKTTYTTVTKPATATAPVKTSYAACGSANIFNGPTGSVGAILESNSVEVRNVSTAQECCNKCQAHTSSSGAKDCAGSFFASSNGQYTCVLRITSSCSTNNVGFFKAYASNQSYKGYVSNGPCGRWNIQKESSTPSYS